MNCLNQFVVNFETSYFPGSGNSTLLDWDSNEGYIIKMNQERTFSLSGYSQVGTGKQLMQGWNLLPVMKNCNVACNQIESLLSGHLVIILEIAGNRMYWPQMDVKTLEELLPGKTYFIKVNSDLMLDFPACQ